MERLTPDQRDAIALRYLAELPFADIGQQLGVSEGAAKMRVKRALKTLKAAMESSGEDGE